MVKYKNASNTSWSLDAIFGFFQRYKTRKRDFWVLSGDKYKHAISGRVGYTELWELLFCEKICELSIGPKSNILNDTCLSYVRRGMCTKHSNPLIRQYYEHFGTAVGLDTLEVQSDHLQECFELSIRASRSKRTFDGTVNRCDLVKRSDTIDREGTSKLPSLYEEIDHLRSDFIASVKGILPDQHWFKTAFDAIENLNIRDDDSERTFFAFLAAFMVLGLNIRIEGEEAAADVMDRNIRKYLSEFIPVLSEAESNPLTEKEYFFSEPRPFVAPENAVDRMMEEAYKDGAHVYAISGQRGMGKTLLAKYFSWLCRAPECPRGNLRFKHVLLTSYSEKGLEDTIALLLNKEHIKGASTSFAEAIKWLQELERPSLLIIDNYDNEDFAEELQESNFAYKALLGTECFILLTSRCDLRGCHAVDQLIVGEKDDQTKNAVAYLSDQDRCKLFSRVWGKPTENSAEVMFLINDILQRNTYGIVLAAATLQTDSISPCELIESLKNHKNGLGRIRVEKNGQREVGDMLELYEALFDVGRIFEKDPNRKKILFNLALLPIDGLPYEEFFAQAFSPDEQKTMRDAFENLLDTYWAFCDTNTETKAKTVRLHPLVRGMIANRKADFSYPLVERYISRVTQVISPVLYSSQLLKGVKPALSAYEICKQMEIENFGTAALLSCLSSAYDVMQKYEAAYMYGTKAQELLEKTICTLRADDKDGKLAAGGYYNAIGVGILHGAREDSIQLAARAFENADRFLREYSEATFPASVLRAKLQGNFAALYIRKGDGEKEQECYEKAEENYREALQRHKAAIDYRRILCKDFPRRESSLLLAASLKNAATVNYKLAQLPTCVDPIAKLEDSLEDHRKAVSTYESVLTLKNFDTVIALNRKVGTGIQLLMLKANFEDSDWAKEQLADYFQNMSDASSYLCSIAVPMDKEIENCLKNTSALMQLSLKYTPASKSLLETGFEIAKRFSLKYDSIVRSEHTWIKYISQITNTVLDGKYFGK